MLAAARNDVSLVERRFDVPRVVARVNDAENAWLFDHRWGVDTAVPAATPLISLIEEATGAADTVALLRLSRAGVDIVETVITTHSRAAGHSLAEIVLPEGAVIATVVRAGQPTVPTPDMRLCGADVPAGPTPTVTLEKPARCGSVPRTTTTGHCAWPATLKLVEPSSRSARPPRPRYPSTSAKASRPSAGSAGTGSSARIEAWTRTSGSSRSARSVADATMCSAITRRVERSALNPGSALA